MNITEWDDDFEGEIVSLWSVVSGMGDARPDDEVRRDFFDRCRARVLAGRAEGLTDDEMRKSIRTTLVCYNFAPDTFPIDKWLEA